MSKLTPLRYDVLQYAKRFPNFNPTNSARRALVWLIENEFLEGEGNEGSRWRLTDKGHAVLESRS